MVKITLTPGARAGFEGLPVLIKVRVLKIFERLRAWPAVSGAKAIGHRDRFYDD